MPSLPTVLVTDGEHRAALATTRALGRAGYSVVVASPRQRSLAGVSRWAQEQVQTPDPLINPEGFVTAVQSVLSQREIRVLLPIADQSIGPLLASRSRLANTVIPFPSETTWRRMADKAQVTLEASKLGIAVPPQIVLEKPSPEVPVSVSDSPVVVKPSRSLASDGAGATRLSVRHASDRASLDRVLAELPPIGWPVLVQRRIIGPGMGVFLLLKSGEPLACFGHRRVLEKPPAGGVSVCSESIELPPDLLDRSIALLRRFEWEGVAMVEYKLDARSGTPYLMEVNGRFWGSLQLAVDAGVNFPRLLVEAALGIQGLPVRTWTSGLRCRWRMGEVDHLLARLRRSPTALSLPPDAPSLATAFKHALVPAWGHRERGEVFRWNDPWPGVVEFAEWIRGR
jgi:predicted ATP-grasp superfamily ATP-dependent carboligase